jgi:hypothetical protein
MNEIQLLDSQDSIVELVAGLMDGIVPDLGFIIKLCEV